MKLSKLHLVLLSIAVAILSISLLFPLSYLMGTGLYWKNPASEVNISLAALRYYVSEPLWFPIGFIESINVPEGTNILYGSSVPLFSFLAKVLNQTSGININSILVWSLFSNILQGVSFAYLSIVFNIRNASIIALMTIVGMLMPSYLWRLENTVALPHFFIIFSIVFYFIISGQENALPKMRRAFIIFTVMVISSFAINPYFTAMIIPLLLATTIKMLIKKKISLLFTLGNLLFLVFGMAFISYVFGYFYGAKFSTSIGGFNFFSMNLIAPFDVGHSSIFRFFIPDLSPANPTGGQQEGFQYLGLGWTTLILVSAFIFRKNFLASFRQHYIFILTLLLMALFALSNKIYVGNFLLVEYPLPAFLDGLIQTFRAPGRFFWPMGYLLVGMAIIAIVRELPKAAPYILFGAIFIQIADTHHLRKSLWNITSGTYEGVARDKHLPLYSVGGIPSISMEYILNNHSALRQYPSWWCGGISDQLLEMEISFIASRHLLSQNSFYSARKMKDCKAEELDVRAISALDPNTLYIFGGHYVDSGRLFRQGVDLSACFQVENLDPNRVEGMYPEETLLYCSEKFRSRLEDLSSNLPKDWKYNIVPVNLPSSPTVSNISSSGSYQEDLYSVNNVLDNRMDEVGYPNPDFWIAPNHIDGWIRLGLDDTYFISEIRLLNTNNGGVGDRGAGKVTIELYDKDNSITFKDTIKVDDFPNWTSLKINPALPANNVKIQLTIGKLNGTGLNEIKIIGVKKVP